MVFTAFYSRCVRIQLGMAEARFICFGATIRFGFQRSRIVYCGGCNPVGFKLHGWQSDRQRRAGPNSRTGGSEVPTDIPARIAPGGSVRHGPRSVRSLASRLTRPSSHRLGQCRPICVDHVGNGSQAKGREALTISDLERLDSYLGSDQSPANLTLLSDFDGFLTGVLRSRDLIMPSEWLPVVWGTTEPDVEDVDKHIWATQADLERYNVVARSLNSDPPVLEPIFWRRLERNVI